MIKIVCPECKRKVKPDRIIAEACFVCPVCGYETEVRLC